VVAAVAAALGGDRDAQFGEPGGVAPDGPLVHTEALRQVAAAQFVVCLEQFEHRQHPGRRI